MNPVLRADVTPIKLLCFKGVASANKTSLFPPWLSAQHSICLNTVTSSQLASKTLTFSLRLPPLVCASTGGCPNALFGGGEKDIKPSYHTNPTD